MAFLAKTSKCYFIFNSLFFPSLFYFYCFSIDFLFIIGKLAKTIILASKANQETKLNPAIL